MAFRWIYHLLEGGFLAEVTKHEALVGEDVHQGSLFLLRVAMIKSAIQLNL
jgi:hypothetical protein